jgi:hypothetical protein
MKKYLIYFVIIASINLVAVYFMINVNYFDYARMSSDKNDTLYVGYKSLEDNGPNWFVRPKSGKPDTNSSTEYFYLEPDNEDLIMPENLQKSNVRFKLVGSFYYDEGLPRFYSMTDGEKPDPARVFKYKRYEVIR